VGKSLSFEPSKKLSILTGILEGLSERKKQMEEAEAVQAKNQSSLIRQLLPTILRERGEQGRFDVREVRETKEFGAGQELNIAKFDFAKANAQFNREFDLKMRDMKNTFTNLAREDEQRFDLEMSKLKQTFDLRLKDLEQAFATGERKAGQTFTTGERGAGQAFTTEERKAGQKFREIENQLDRELQRDLRGEAFSKEEQVVVSNYQSAAVAYNALIGILINPVHTENELLNQQAVQAADEMARWADQLRPIYESKGLASPLVPPTIQPFEDRGKGIFNFGRDQQFGFLPRLKVPTDVETIDKPVEAVETKTSKKISAIEKTPVLTTSGDEFNQFVQSLQAQMKQQKKSSIKLDDRSRKILLEKGFDADAIERAASGR
jgi:hypothetical protein